MNNNDPDLIRDTLQIVREGLASMENLQRQTAAAHQKFLETQTQASRTLQEMMESTRLLTQAALGGPPADRPVAPIGGFTEPAAVVGKKTGQTTGTCDGARGGCGFGTRRPDPDRKKC